MKKTREFPKDIHFQFIEPIKATENVGKRVIGKKADIWKNQTSLKKNQQKTNWLGIIVDDISMNMLEKLQETVAEGESL